MSFRPATINDSRLLYRWRQTSEDAPWYEGEPTTYREHQAWLALRLNDPLVKLLIWEDAYGKPVGTVRIDSNGEISFHANDPSHTTDMLTAAAEYAPSYGGRLKAVLDSDDQQKVRDLERAGFSTFRAANLIYTVIDT